MAHTPISAGFTLAPPFNDPIAESIDEYQSFLKTLGYSPIAEAAFGKSVGFEGRGWYFILSYILTKFSGTCI
jgi:hypothetical protein